MLKNSETSSELKRRRLKINLAQPERLSDKMREYAVGYSFNASIIDSVFFCCSCKHPTTGRSSDKWCTLKMTRFAELTSQKVQPRTPRVTKNQIERLVEKKNVFPSGWIVNDCMRDSFLFLFLPVCVVVTLTDNEPFIFRSPSNPQIVPTKAKQKLFFEKCDSGSNVLIRCPDEYNRNSYYNYYY